MRPVVLAIAGSDSGGGAGIQADIRAIEAQGGFATTAITAVTAQNSVGVRSIHAIPSRILRDQIDAVLDDFPVAALKSGMLPDLAAIREVARAARRCPALPLVVDPVLVATSGARLSPAELGRAWIAELGAVASLWTPNTDEAAVLAGMPVESPEQAERAGHVMLQAGAEAVLITGGHRQGEAVDVLVQESGTVRFVGPRVEGETHGSGCTFASGIAARLAAGDDLEKAIRTCKSWIAGAISHSLKVGAGEGPVDSLWAFRTPRALEDEGSADS